MPKGNNRLVGYRVPRSNKFVIRIVFATVLMTLAILAILPFTQALSGDPLDKTIRSVNTWSPPPPEPPPPEPPPPPEEEEQEETPEMQEPPQMLDLSQLESALNPGTGGAFAGAFDLDSFAVNADVASQMIFEIADLDRKPRMTRRVLPQYPQQLQADGVEGQVSLVLIIDEQGRVSVEKVMDWSGHRDFIQPTRIALSRCLFEPPTKDGQPVRARYKITIPFNL